MERIGDAIMFTRVDGLHSGVVESDDETLQMRKPGYCAGKILPAHALQALNCAPQDDVRDPEVVARCSAHFCAASLRLQSDVADVCSAVDKE